jgi:3-isopropylmalate/(R)-2-methylmalate dehydratase small subunit
MNDENLVIRGKVAAVLPDNTDTDIIFPGRYLNITDREKTAEHLFELVYPNLRKALEPGDILVAGKNFGCGSSREQATAAIKFSGVGAVIAISFARIFYRNSINLGLPLVVSEDLNQVVEPGDRLELDLCSGAVRLLDARREFAVPPMDARAVELLRAGGLIPYLKRKYAAPAASGREAAV